MMDMDIQLDFFDFPTGIPYNFGSPDEGFTDIAVLTGLPIRSQNSPDSENDMIPLSMITESVSDDMLNVSRRKRSIDITQYIPLQKEEVMESPVAVVCETNNEVPQIHLSPSVCAFPSSGSYSLLHLIDENKRLKCKERRHQRMEILRRKRENGEVSFHRKVRYQGKSEFAKNRSRFNGRFVSDIQYINAI